MTATATTTPIDSSGELARLRAELADLPNQIEQATEAGDETLLAKLLVRDRVLERMIAQAERAAHQKLLDGLRMERQRLAGEFGRAVAGLADIKFAAEVYARAAINRQQRAEPLRQQLNHIDRRIMDVEDKEVS